MAVPTRQRARRRRPQSVQSSLHSSCTSSLCSYISGLRRLLHSTWYWPFSRYWQYGRIVATRYGSIDATTATQLLINTTWFSLPRDIGTPRHWNPESKHRDIGTSGHRNPECTGRGKAPTREPAKGTDPMNGIFQVSPRASSAVSSLPGSWPSRSCYDVLGRCMLLAGAVFGLFFQRL